MHPLHDREHTADLVSIRSGAEDDACAVEALYAELSEDVGNVARDFRTIVRDPNATCLLAEVENRPVGMAIFFVRSSLSSGRKMVIDDIVVESGHRRRGIGRALMKRCISLATEHGLDCVELACSLSKPDLHSFYEGLGFRHRMRLYSLLLADG